MRSRLNEIASEVDGSGTILRRYVSGADADEPLVWYEGSGTSDRRWLIPDEKGSIIAVTDGAGQQLAINSYDEYGIPASTNLGRFQYTGQAWLPEMGLYYYKARMYSATLGRFLQTDPIGYADGMNWYNYAHSDPVNGKDPSGTAVFINVDVKDEGGSEGPEIVVTGQRPGPCPHCDAPPITGNITSVSSLAGIGGAAIAAAAATNADDMGQRTQTCPRLRPGAGLSGTLDGIENLLGTTSDVTGAAEGAILAFGVANAVVGDEPGAAGSFVAAGIAGTASTFTGGLKDLVQLGRGNFGAAGSTFLGLATGQAVKRGFGLFGRAVGIGRNEAGDAFSSVVSDQAGKRAEAAGCGG